MNGSLEFRNRLKRLAYAILPVNFVDKLLQVRRRFYWKNNPPADHRKSYSTEGEDMMLACLFHKNESGFYVDVGAHHPKRSSNTYYFYLRGWRGINIDAMPGSMAIFNETRKRDINLEIAIADSRKKLTYYGYDEPSLNGFDKELVDENERQGKYRVIFQRDMETRTLGEVLDEYMPLDQRIDFLNVDVEGLDYEVLISNNWRKYRPEVVLVEALGISTLAALTQSRIASFMEQQGYDFYGKTLNTLIFRKAMTPLAG